MPSHHMSPGKSKWKQRDTTTNLLKWPKSKTLTTPNAGVYVQQQELSFNAHGNATAILEDSLGFLQY